MSRSDAETKPEATKSVDPARAETPAGRDDLAAAGANGRDPGTNEGANPTDSTDSTDRRRVRLIYGAIALITLAVTTINALSQQADLARFSGRTIEAWKPFVWEWTSGIVIVALTPLIRRVALRASRCPIAVQAVAHLGGAAVFLAGHLVGIVLLRKLIYGLAGAGPYTLAFTAENILYEARKDAILYAMLAGVFHAARRLGLDRAPPPPTVMAAADAAGRDVWLRDGGTNVRVAACDIVWVASAGNYIEYALADGRKHLIRGTLQGEEGRLARHGLVRVHRTRLINARRVRRVTTLAAGGFEAEMDTGEVIAGSRSYRDRVTALTGSG